MTSILREAREILLLPLVVGVMALCLYLLGMVPAQLQSQVVGVRQYSSLEAAQSDLGFAIAMPAYFPSYLSWPPASIRGEFEPVLSVQTTFLSPEHAPVLVVSQTVSDSQEAPTSLPWMLTAQGELPVDIGGSQGVLAVGRGADGQVLNGVCWQADGFQFAIVTTEPVQELLLLARSMRQ
ncbi:MAG: hypothetical protein V1691_03185 [Chloroflexota bacterium]